MPSVIGTGMYYALLIYQFVGKAIVIRRICTISTHARTHLNWSSGTPWGSKQLLDPFLGLLFMTGCSIVAAVIFKINTARIRLLLSNIVPQPEAFCTKDWRRQNAAIEMQKKKNSVSCLSSHHSRPAPQTCTLDGGRNIDPCADSACIELMPKKMFTLRPINMTVKKVESV